MTDIIKCICNDKLSIKVPERTTYENTSGNDGFSAAKVKRN